MTKISSAIIDEQNHFLNDKTENENYDHIIIINNDEINDNDDDVRTELLTEQPKASSHRDNIQHVIFWCVNIIIACGCVLLIYYLLSKRI